MNADYVVPGLVVLLLVCAAWKRLPAYDLFVRGAGEGIRTAVAVMPNLAAMLCAIELMNASGLMEAFCGVLSPVMTSLGLPGETAPLLLLRPLSGSASLAALEEILSNYGPDSRIGLFASTVMGSSETIFYTMCVYTSSCSKKDAGYALPCSLIGMACGIWMAALLIWR